MMTKAFPGLSYLWLIRRDKARQAISYLLARKTGEWWMLDRGESSKSVDTITEIDFEPRALADLEEALSKNDLAWQSYFHHNNILPFIVYYEELAADYRGVIVRVLQWLGVRNADAVVVRPSRFKRQSRERNERWLRGYMRFKAERSHHPPQGST